MDKSPCTNELNQLSFLQNNTATGFALISVKYNFLFSNIFLSNQLGYLECELAAINFIKLIANPFRNNVELYLTKIFHQEVDSFYLEIQILTKKGNAVWFSLTVTYNVADSAAFCIISNIEERKLKELRLSEQESLFHSIAENSNDFIMRYDLAFRHTYLNPASLRILHIQAPQLIGKTHVESGLFNAEQCDFFESKLNEVVTSGKKLQTQFVLNDDGKELYIDWCITPEFDANGSLISLLGISRDITDVQLVETELNKKCAELSDQNNEIQALNEKFRAANEELIASYSSVSSLYTALEESEEKYRNAFLTIPDSVTITTLNGAYVDVNKGFTRIAGYAYNEVVNSTVFEINIWNDSADRDLFIKELTKNGHVSNMECDFRAKDGSLKTLLLSSCFIKIKGVPHILLIAHDITEWKRTQAENLQFVEIVSTMQTGIYVYYLEDINNDRTLKLVNANAASSSCLGLDQNQIINKYIDDIFPKLREQNIPQKFASVVQTGISLGSTLVYYADDNIPSSCFDFKAIPLANNHVCVLFEDLTSQKEAEAAYSESENKYREIFNSTNEAILIEDPSDDKLIEINEATLKLYGYPNYDDILTGKVSQFSANIFPYTEEQAQAYKKQALADGPQVYEWLAKKKNGELFWVEVSIRKTTLGGKLRIIAVIHNINERKLAEEALRDSEQRFNMAFRNSTVSIIISTLAEGKFIDVNQSFLRVMGYTREEVIGFTSTELGVFVNNRDRFRFLDKLQTDGLLYGEECLLRTKEGVVLTCLVSIGIIPLQGEKCMLTTLIDISARKLMELELVNAKNKAEESDRLKSAFLANMSHEIRTPMNAIKGFAQLLERADMQEAKKYKFTQIISQRTDDLLTLINDLLDIAKIEAGQLTLVEQRDNVNNLFKEIFQFFKAQQLVLEPKMVELSFINELTLTQNYICTDFFRLRQILINLVSNALKFTEQGRVLFGCRLCDENTLLFYVQDSGIGIPEDKFNLIFEPFRQVNDLYLTKRKGGTGLGLSIVKGLVELMKGKVWFESQYGQGTIFYFTLPFVQTPVLQPKVEVVPEREYSWINKKILVVEDDESNTLLMNELLENTKATCFYAASASESLVIYQNNPDIDLVLMDIQLPDINGFDLASEFKAVNPNLLIIAQTAYASDADKTRALEVGCCGFIAKPIDQYKLLLMIQMCFDGEQADNIN